MSDKIKEAMTKLDVGNDNHWTQDGQARLDTVKFLSGGETISREDLDKDYPGFNRTTASAYFMGTGTQDGGKLPEGDQNPGQDVDGNHTAIDKPALPVVDGTDSQPDSGNADIRPGQDAEGNLVGVVKPDTPTVPAALYNPATATPAPATGSSGPAAAGELYESPRADGAGTAAQATQPGDTPAAGETEQPAMGGSGDNEPDEVEELEADLEEAEAYLADLLKTRDELNKAIDDANKSADETRGKLAKLRGSENTNAIQSYLESRKTALQKRGENRQTLKDSGLTLKSIAQAVAPAPIDSAMARKNNRGAKRPTRV
jgi:hypothetical protein